MNGLLRYDPLTQVCIIHFLNDFQAIFPNVLSNQELMDLIVKNMPGNIMFNQDLEDKVVGLYDGYCIKTIRELEGVYLRKVLFHEFIHVITKCALFNLYSEYSDLIEGLTTLCEERFVEYYGIGQKRRRVNGYIPDLVRELNVATDDQLLTTFLKSPDSIYKCFYPLEYLDEDVIPRRRFFNTFSRFIEDNKDIISMSKDKVADSLLDPVLISCERDILFQYYVRCMSGEIEFSFDKLEEVYFNQIKPDIDLYIQFMKEEITLGNLDINNTFGDSNLIDLYKISELNGDIFDEFIDFDSNEIEWLAANYFGFGAYLDKVVNAIDLANHDTTLDEYYDKYDNFNKLKCFYSKLMELLLYGFFTEDKVRDCRFVLGDEEIDSYMTKDYFLHRDSCELLLSAIFDESEYNIDSCLFKNSNDDVTMLIYDGFSYYPYSFQDVLSRVETIKNPSKKNYLRMFINQFNNCDCIYLNTSSEFFEDGDFVNIFIPNGNNFTGFYFRFDFSKNTLSRSTEILEFNGEEKSVFNDDSKYFEFKREF